MKKIVVIGASSGLGYKIASDFARVGCRVGIAARREERLETLKQLYPDRIAKMTIDVTTPDAVKRFYDLIELIDGMDYLVYCAGVGFEDPELDDAKTRSMLETNVVGFGRIIAAAYRYYRDTANDYTGHIAAITSIAGTRGIGVAAAYSASKTFQQRFIDALEQLSYQQEVNVRFTDIRPGFIRTELLDSDKQYPMCMSVTEVAPTIEEAILRGKRRLVVDSRWRAVDAAWRAVPDALWKRTSILF